MTMNYLSQPTRGMEAIHRALKRYFLLPGDRVLIGLTWLVVERLDKGLRQDYEEEVWLRRPDGRMETRRHWWVIENADRFA